MHLRDDVGPEATAGMIDRFLTMLPGRVEQLRSAVASGEPPRLRDTALSLGSSATMLGAHRLATLSRRCRTDAQALGELERVALATCRALVALRAGLSSGA